MPVSQPARPERWVPQDNFGNRLILVRRELGLTQAQAAEMCGLDAGSWNNWEHGTRPRGLDEIVKKIADALGVDRDWLMWGSTSLRKVHKRTGELALVSSRQAPDQRFSVRSGVPLVQLAPLVD